MTSNPTSFMAERGFMIDEAVDISENLLSRITITELDKKDPNTLVIRLPLTRNGLRKIVANGKLISTHVSEAVAVVGNETEFDHKDLFGDIAIFELDEKDPNILTIRLSLTKNGVCGGVANGKHVVMSVSDYQPVARSNDVDDVDSSDEGPPPLVEASRYGDYDDHDSD